MRKAPRWQTRDHEKTTTLNCRLCSINETKKNGGKSIAIFDQFRQRRQILFVWSWELVERRRKSIVLNFCAIRSRKLDQPFERICWPWIKNHAMLHMLQCLRWLDELSPADCHNVDPSYWICCSLKSIWLLPLASQNRGGQQGSNISKLIGHRVWGAENTHSSLQGRTRNTYGEEKKCFLPRPDTRLSAY